MDEKLVLKIVLELMKILGVSGEEGWVVNYVCDLLLVVGVKES